ncbi:hypothetical protein HE1_00468 [Holospora elegans E1]|uniref:Uncharacterized protein n=1 Tax=Holospora elegans E1 TaxID=1427503 RepID=A0A023DY52_9PROT|nr:hypothetical protein HE1_00468 [Holospora elegans E1]
MFCKKVFFWTLSFVGATCLSEKNQLWAVLEASKGDTDVLCVVGKRVIKKSEIEQILQQISNKRQGKEVSEEEKKRLREDYITMCQLSEWAKAQKLDELPETKSALDQAYISAALRKLGESAEQATKEEINKEITNLKKDEDIMKSVVIETVIVDKKGKDGKKDMEGELKKLENLKNDLSGKIFETWAKKFQINNPNGEYKVNDLTVKMLKSNPQLEKILKEMHVGDIKVVPLDKESSLVLVVRFMKEGVRTSESTLSRMALQGVKSKKMQELIKKVKEEFPVKE